jgi:uroporphyrinogen decarboxylase
MNSRERVLAAINHTQPDQTPIDFGGTLMSECLPEFLHAMREVLGYTLPPDRDPDGTLVDEQIQRYLNVDLRLVPINIPRAVLKDIDPPAYQQAHSAHEAQQTVQAARSDIITRLVMTEFPLANASYEDLKATYRPEPRPPYSEPQMAYLVETARQHRANGYATTYWISSGLFEIGCWQRGYHQFMLDIADRSDVVRLMFERMLAARLVEIEQVVVPLSPYVDIFCFGDDLAMQNRPFLSPRTFRSLVFPYLEQMYRRVHQLAPHSYVFHHSCGSVYTLLDDLIGAGVNVMNPTQVSAVNMEPWRIKEKAAGRLTFHGGVDLQEVLPRWSPEAVKANVEEVIRVLGKGGGYICAPCHSLPEDVPIENILAMCEARRTTAS